ncbi:MAG: DUF1015 domain-containing protein [Deltaproteobacteria bacterium]
MTEIKPFRAIVYNPEKVKDVSRVVCPPYDIISPAQQQYYHEASPYNLIRLILGKDVPGENKYERAAVHFNEWLKNKILVQDKEPAAYFYHQQYKVRGEVKTRLGFIALLKLDEQKTSVFAHEHTRLEPKEDRLMLIRQVKANLSPIFVVFSDQKRIIQRTYQKYMREEAPFIDITDDDKIVHKVWRLNQPDVLEEIKNAMHNENIFIADGHHRYEVACAYRDELKGSSGSTAVPENLDFIMAYFTGTESRELTIFPIHRLVKVGPQFDLRQFISALVGYFDIEEIKDRTQFFFWMEKAGSIEHVLGMYRDKKYWLLRLKNVKILDKMINDKPPEYRTLDVSILNHLVLKNVLGINPQDQSGIEYIHDADTLIRRVDSEGSSIAFFLNPVRMPQIMAVALKGEKLPPKSTFFYPKVLSGLVINKF